MNLFQFGDFEFHSGQRSNFKIDCDALSKGDWRAVALLASRLVAPFDKVVSVPTGGNYLANALEDYTRRKDEGLGDLTRLLIVDDVYTTGASMEAAKSKHGQGWGQVSGLVLFSRVESTPTWIEALFWMGRSTIEAAELASS